MECNFVVGQKVVCVEDISPWFPVKQIKKEEIVTIREIYGTNDIIGLRFEEYKNFIDPDSGVEYGYYSEYFSSFS